VHALHVLLLLAVAALVGYPIYARMRSRVRAGSTRRPVALAGAALAIAAGLALALVVPRHVPDTPGTPATLVAIALLWILGGSIVFAGLAALLGAWFARAPGATPRA
jgi:MFS family permease